MLAFLLSLQQIGQPDAASNEEDTPISKLFSSIDSDGDGSLSADEFSTFVQSLGGSAEDASELYSSIDSDGDGAVSEEELASALPPPPPPLAEDAAGSIVSALDSDGDGALSKSELEAFATSVGGSSEEAESILEALDTDDSGTVSTAELTQRIQALLQSFENVARSSTETSTTEIAA
ncbi:EF-hand domain-containing protein [Blastochloris viridis]|uniref:EF-hand domain-containing protein n=1 Tax=Blastochloris viridis TaxID=1079 RepID=UPI0006D83160|nr:EF-hand domain-containing protein [Blastochloris viridis]